MSGSTTSNPKTIRRRAVADTPPIASEERARAFGAPELAGGRAERSARTRPGERTPPTAAPTLTELALELANDIAPATTVWTRGAPPPSFFEDWPDAVLRFDRTLAVVYANPALERATALSRGVFIGHRLDQVEGFEAFAPLWLAKLAELFATEEACLFKFAFTHPTGRKLFDVRLAPEREGGQAETLYATAVLRDVTVPRHALRASREADELVDTVLASAKIGIA
ncbi:MAG TPA: PAS domain-containing protein, partial [Burkholderiaceae bacterium]|nr:PAS domain-containing protein [Burkholderiaceae bacterium]